MITLYEEESELKLLLSKKNQFYPEELRRWSFYVNVLIFFTWWQQSSTLTKKSWCHAGNL